MNQTNRFHNILLYTTVWAEGNISKYNHKQNKLQLILPKNWARDEAITIVIPLGKV